MPIECNEIQQFRYIYRHRRLDTNEIFYIGIGTGDNFKRSRNKSTRNNLWKKITSKTSYEIEIIYKNLSHSDACELEMLLISEYGRIDLKTGSLCNLTDGGEGLLNISNEHRKKISLSSKNRIWSDESRKKLSDYRLNTPLSEYQLIKIKEAAIRRRGVKLSEKHRLKMSKNSYLAKKVIDTNTGIVYNSAIEVSKIFLINQNTLRSYLTGIRTNKTTFKYMI